MSSKTWKYFFSDLIVGKLDVHDRGSAHLLMSNGEDIFIRSNNLKGACDKDIVSVQMVDKKNNEDLYNPRPYYECIVKQGTSENYCCVSKQIPWIGDVRLYVWKNKDARDSVIHMRKQFMFTGE